MYFKQIKEILDGSKTQTRRVCKPGERLIELVNRQGNFSPTVDTLLANGNNRKKWQEGNDYAVSPGRGKPGVWWNPETGEWAIPYTTKRYKFDGPQELLSGMIFAGWQPLRIKFTDIGREPLQAITEADAIAEGYPHGRWGDPQTWYRELWENINGAGSWDDNPDVWCLEFSVIK